MKIINVLITGSGSLYGVAIIRELLKTDLPLRLVACDQKAGTLGVHLAHRAYIVFPAQEEERYYEQMQSIINREKIQAVFVASSQEIEFYSRHRREIEKQTGAKVFVNYPEILRICNDKWLTVRFLEEQGFFFPKTLRYPEERKKLEAWLCEVQFPVVTKPRRGAGSQGVHVVEDQEKLAALLENQSGIIIQQYLTDDAGEFTTGICTGKDGRILSGITLKRHLQDGMTISAESGPFAGITDYCRKIARALSSYGPCNFQSRLLDGKPHVFEINPRFSSSTGMRCLFGVNEAEILIRAEVLGETVEDIVPQQGSAIRQYADYLVSTDKIAKLEAEGVV
jgi:carbamoyl-phosphate synthase large subunit